MYNTYVIRFSPSQRDILRDRMEKRDFAEIHREIHLAKCIFNAKHQSYRNDYDAFRIFRKQISSQM